MTYITIKDMLSLQLALLDLALNESARTLKDLDDIAPANDVAELVHRRYLLLQQRSVITHTLGVRKCFKLVNAVK